MDIVHRLIWFFCFCAMVLFCFSCGSKQNTETQFAPVKRIGSVAGEPAFSVDNFVPLQPFAANRTLPYLVVNQGGKTQMPTCLLPDDNSQAWLTSNKAVLNKFNQHMPQIKELALLWFRNNLVPPASRQMVQPDWMVRLFEPTIVHSQMEGGRLVKEQKCFNRFSRQWPAGSRVVTTLFGYKRIRLRSPNGLDIEVLEQSVKTGKAMGVDVKIVETYPRAKDADGKPIVRDGKKMYVSPDWRQVPAGEVPPRSKRPVYEVILTFETVLALAYGDSSPVKPVSQEFLPGHCNLDLIFDDPVARKPRCAEYSAEGFGVSAGESRDEVVVKVFADGEIFVKTVPFNKQELIQAGGRILAWVTPRKLMEGATLEVDSMVLFTKEKPPVQPVVQPAVALNKKPRVQSDAEPKAIKKQKNKIAVQKQQNQAKPGTQKKSTSSAQDLSKSKFAAKLKSKPVLKVNPKKVNSKSDASSQSKTAAKSQPSVKKSQPPVKKKSAKTAGKTNKPKAEKEMPPPQYLMDAM